MSSFTECVYFFSIDQHISSIRRLTTEALIQVKFCIFAYFCYCYNYACSESFKLHEQIEGSIPILSPNKTH